jgi:N-acetylmuramate 1-kinase
MTKLALDRLELKYNFLRNSLPNQNFALQPILADASLRNYYRLIIDDKSYILMDCPPDYTCIKPFIKVAEFLRISGLSAPEIYHTDDTNGFLLLEDFGDLSVCKYINNNPDRTDQIYKLIVALLSTLRSTAIPNDLPIYSDELLLSELKLYTDWYIPYVTGKKLNSKDESEYFDIWKQIIEKLPDISPSIVLRDFHVENMLVLNRAGISAVGLIDFQDALIGSPIYDLVSVLEDARIDVSKETASKFIDYYADSTPEISKNDILLSYHILGAQRNSRILGVFARKFLQDNNPNYLQYIPRVLSYLNNDLSHPALTSLRLWVEKNLPIIR